MVISKNRVFIIAEMANSHEGVLENAKKIVSAVSEAGADAIKFQKFFADELAEPSHEYYSLYKKLEMTNSEWKKLILFSKSKKLKVFVDVFGIKSAKQISKFTVDGFKIHSSDVGNLKLLNFLAQGKKPILLSMAGCIPNEIHTALKILQKTPKQIILMHGFQDYPTKIQDMHLNRISEIKRKYGKTVGLMDHISGSSDMAIAIPLLGVGMGAAVIEKHITLDRTQKGLDYYSALNPSQFKKMVSTIRQTEKAIGSQKLDLSKNEINYRLQHKKNSVAKTFIKKGTTLRSSMFEFKRTKTKQQPISLTDFDGQLSASNISKGQILKSNMILKTIPKTAAVIACRVGSERLFAKPLQIIGGFTILHLLIKQIQKSKIISDIILAISEKPGNEIFVNFAKENNLKFIEGDDLDVLKRLIDGARYVNATTIFRTTADCPFINWEQIDPILKNHFKKTLDFSILKNIPIGSGFEVINLNALEKSHRKGQRKHRSELASLYIYEHKQKFKIQELEPRKELQRPDLRLTVDNPEDLLVARIIQDEIGKNDSPIELKKIIKFLDKNPEVKKINSGIPVGKAKLW